MGVHVQIKTDNSLAYVSRKMKNDKEKLKDYIFNKVVVSSREKTNNYNEVIINSNLLILKEHICRVVRSHL